MRLVSLCLILLLAGVVPAVSGVVTLKELSSIPLVSTPRQVTSTTDGRRMYVLTQDAKILIYTLGGELQGTLEVDPTIDRIVPLGPNYLLLQKSSKQQAVIAQVEISQQIDTSNSPRLGSPDAPVTITVFDDFECPYCAKTVPLLKQVLEKYKDKASLVFKNFPLANHRNARNAALTALAANQQGKFWEVHDLLYENYNRLNPKKIDELAAQAGLDMDKLQQDRSDPLLNELISRDINEGNSIGVNGTPTVFINGRLLGERSLAGFSRMIDEELTRLGQTSQP